MINLKIQKPNLRNIDVEIPCPKDGCDGKINVKPSKTKKGDVVVCPKCKAKIELTD